MKRFKDKIKEKYGYEDDVIVAALLGAVAGGLLVGLGYRSVLSGKVLIDPTLVYMPYHISQEVAAGGVVRITDHLIKTGLPDMLVVSEPSIKALAEIAKAV